MTPWKVFFDAVSSIFLGIGLPSGDVGTDVNLGARLILNGHPNWAMFVLAPVITSTFFTLFACRRLENRNWLCYIPLVVMQIYPQFCVLRLLRQWWKGDINQTRFIGARDNLDGGLGCIESYLESVPQAFIQTAFFVVANSLTSTVTRLCYNDKARSCDAVLNQACMLQKRCSDMGFDGNHCNPVGFGSDVGFQQTNCNPSQTSINYHYKSYANIKTCKEKTINCTEMFQICIQPFYECLSRCETKLTSEIDEMDEQALYQMISNVENYSNFSPHFLAIEYGASREDLQNIQLYLLFIGDKAVFLGTYAISVFAAAYGVTKFFRLSYSRHCDTMYDSNHGVNPRTFIVTFVITTMYLLAKGFALAAFVMINENSMATNVTLWSLYCMLPSFAFAIVVIFGRTFYRIKFKGFTIFNNYSLSIFLKEPPVIGASVVTPFMYSPKSVEKLREVEASNRNQRIMYTSKLIFFQIDYGFSYFNNFIGIFVGTIGLILKTDQKLQVLLPSAVLFFIITTVLLYIVAVLDNGGSKKCFEHATNKSDCIECTEKYGLYIKDYKLDLVCASHKIAIPCEECEKLGIRVHPFGCQGCGKYN